MNKLSSYQTPLQDLEVALDATFFKVLSEPARIDLIKVLLTLNNADVGTIASNMSQDRSVVSRHLKLMQESGLVTSAKDGKHCCYCLNGDAFVERLEAIVGVVKKATASACC